MSTFLVCVLCGLAMAPSAPSPPVPPAAERAVPVLERLLILRENLELMDKLRANGLEVDPDREKQAALLAEAGTLTAGKVRGYGDLVDATGGANRRPTRVAQLGNLLTLTNLMLVAGSVIIGVAIIMLFGHYLLALILAVPIQAWEVLLWAGFLTLAWSATRVSPAWQLAVLMPACMGFIGTTLLSCRLHGGSGNAHEVPFTILAVVWGAIAMHFGSHVIGFMSVLAGLSALGFVCGYLPGVVYTGFERINVIPRCTLAAGLMLAAHVTLLTAATNIPEVDVFREGMGFMGSFVYYLGILIMSSKWYAWERDPVDHNRVFNWTLYGAMQLLVLCSGFAALYFGTVFGISALLGIGGTFFGLYVLEKYYEIPWRGIGWVWSLLGLGVLMYGMGVMANTYPQYFVFGS